MKRLLLIVPFVLLIALNACGSDPENFSAAQWAAMRQTLTAEAWTAIPTATPHPNIPIMISWLNMDLSITNSLGATMDADYHVNNLSFRNIQNSSNLIFQMDVGCTCMNGADCCIPQRTFVVIVESMKRNRDATLTQVPLEVGQILVICSDQKTKSRIGTISASWPDVQGYLVGRVTGNQLGVHVTRTAP